MPAISVIIPVYNRGPLLQRALASVLAQSIRDYEVIVVDDGSTDDLSGSVPALRTPGVTYIRQANQGVAAARNRALQSAGGDCILFLDSDDTLAPRGLELLHGALLANPYAAAAYGWAVWSDPAGHTSQQRWPVVAGRIGRQYLFANPTPVDTLLLRRQIFEAGYAFDTTLALYEDWDLWLRIAWHYDFVVVPAVVAYVTSPVVQRSNSQPARIVGEVMRTMYAKLSHDPASQAISERYASQLQANVHVMMGHHYRLFEANPGAARREFLAALRAAPLFSRAYVGLAESLLGPGAIRTLRALRSRLFGLGTAPDRKPAG